MPSFAGLNLPVVSEGIPPRPPDRYHVLSEPGMADQSVLFEPDRWNPITIRATITAPSRSALEAILTSMLGLRRTRQVLNDGVYTLNRAVVLGVQSSIPHYSGAIVGGTTESDSWECDILITVLPSPSEA